MHLVSLFEYFLLQIEGSGTEPKLKYYVELSGKDQEKVRQTLDDIVSDIIDNLLEPKKNNLEAPRD
jgi:phosphomannomutase